MDKHYIGDGVYVEYDGFALLLTAENGERVTDRIVIEPDVLQALNEFYRRAVNEQSEK